MNKKVELSSFDFSWYKGGGSFIKRFLWFVCSSIFINSYLPIPMAIKIFILKAFGAKIGKNLTLKPSVNIKFPWFLTIGDHVWIGEKVWIDNFVMVTLENNVCISQNAFLLTGNHDYSKTSFDMFPGEIYIEEGAWVGAKAVVCPGIRIFSHAVLAVGSVATQNLEPYMIYQGNPANHLRNRHIT